MASVLLDEPRTGVWRFSRRDSVLVSLTALHAAVLMAWPIAPVIGLGVWWNSNTIAHNFIHRPFFRSATINRLFSAALSVLLGIPQTLWRERHLAHHAEVSWRLRVSRQLVIETALVLCLWFTLAVLYPRFFVEAYVPGYFAGLGQPVIAVTPTDYGTLPKLYRWKQGQFVQSDEDFPEFFEKAIKLQQDNIEASGLPAYVYAQACELGACARLREEIFSG